MKLFGWEIISSEERAALQGADAYGSNLSTLLATGGDADVNQTAAVEYALGLVARSFMAAEVSPKIPALTPLILSMIARQTMSLGNAVFDIAGDTRGLRFDPVTYHSIAGGVSPDTWRYTIKVPRPNGEDPFDLEQLPTVVRPSAGIVHVRYMPRHGAPWIGVSPLTGRGADSEPAREDRTKP